MKTYAMVLIADHSGKTYGMGDVLYNRQYGFHDKNKNPLGTNVCGSDADGLNTFFHNDGWEVMSHAE